MTFFFFFFVIWVSLITSHVLLRDGLKSLTTLGTDLLKKNAGENK